MKFQRTKYGFYLRIFGHVLHVTWVRKVEPSQPAANKDAP